MCSLFVWKASIISRAILLSVIQPASSIQLALDSDVTDCYSILFVDPTLIIIILIQLMTILAEYCLSYYIVFYYSYLVMIHFWYSILTIILILLLIFSIYSLFYCLYTFIHSDAFYITFLLHFVVFIYSVMYYYICTIVVHSTVPVHCYILYSVFVCLLFSFIHCSTTFIVVRSFTVPDPISTFDTLYSHSIFIDDDIYYLRSYLPVLTCDWWLYIFIHVFPDLWPIYSDDTCCC